MRRIFFLSILFLFCWAHEACGQSPWDIPPVHADLGRQSGPFDIPVSVNTYDIEDTYHCDRDSRGSGKDACFRIETDSSYYVNVHNETEWLTWMHVHCLDESGREIYHQMASTYENGYAQFPLPAGTFYIVAETATGDYGSQEIPEGVLALRFESQPRLPGEDMTRAIDLGTFGGSFSISREVEGYEYYLLDYGLTGDTYHDESGRDVFFRFRLTAPMEVTLGHEGSSGASFTTRLLTAEGDTLEPATHYELMPGEYYVYSLSWQYMKPCLTINLAGTAFATGSDSRWPVELGNFDAGFSCTASCDTRRTLHAHSNDKPGKEAYFRLALSVPMELWMDNCGSEVQDTYLAVRPEAGGAAHEADTGGCDYPEQAALHVPALMPGSYIVMADGATDGEITLNVRGETLGEPGGLLLTAIDAGTHAGGFFFTDTRNTAQGYTDSYGGAANDVFYRFELADSLAVAVHHEGSELEDTRLTLLASDGESVLYSTNGTGQARIEAELPAGVYYAVSEGATGNGILVTNIEGLGESGPLSPSKDRLYTLYTVPTEETEASDDPGAGQARRTVQYHDGFGLTAMKAEQGVSPYGGLLYTFQEQDPLNRPAGDWLPVPLHGTEGAYVDPGVLAAQAIADVISLVLAGSLFYRGIYKDWK